MEHVQEWLEVSGQLHAYGPCTGMAGGEWSASCIWTMYRNG